MTDKTNSTVDLDEQSTENTQTDAQQQEEQQIDTQEALGDLFDEAMSEDFSEDDLEEKFAEITSGEQKDDKAIDKSESTDENSDNADIKSVEEESALDPNKFFEEVTTPFKANGKEVVIDDPEKIKRLMQMGLGYTKQREQINKQLKTIKMLENAGVTNESDLAYLLDLHSKDPKAVQKFMADVQDANIEIDEYAEGDPDYTANPDNYATNNEVVFEETIARLEAIPAFTEVAPILSQWDEESKAAFMQEPAWLEAFTGYKQSGVFDKIMEVVTEERLVGNLIGLSDLEAFDTVGKTLQAQGAFGESPVEGVQQQTVQQQETIKKPQAAQASQLNSNANTQKAAQAAAISQHGSSTQQQAKPQITNPMDLSDEEFEKLYGAELG